MLYTVHTTFKAKDNTTGRITKFCASEKIEALDKDSAKCIAWKMILEDIARKMMLKGEEISFVTLESQSARACKK